MKKLSDHEISEMDRQIDRARRGQGNVAPGGFDPQNIAEHAKDSIRGRDRDALAWRPVMERFGFTWFEPRELDAKVGKQTIIPRDFKGAGLAELNARMAEMGIDQQDHAAINEHLYWYKAHELGQWRSNDRRLAFTVHDLVTMFDSPESFASWMDRRDLERRAAIAGLKVPARR